MRDLLTVAFPRMDEDDLAFLASFKADHSPAERRLVAPHFTLAFRCAHLAEQTYAAHVAAIAQRTKAIDFICRYAMLGADDESEEGYVFLVPEEGFAAIARLHDDLYTGEMEPHLRLDIPYVPHITIGRLKDRRRAKQLCDEFNARGLAIPGRISDLTVCTPQGRGLASLSEHALADGA